MKKFILKSVLYIFLILILLEIIVRVCHLYGEDPPRYIDEYGVEKRVPDNDGYAVTGNRKMNYSKFHINKAGFNSFREFTPSIDKYEMALIGDSFIEGFHQDFSNSIGKQIEDQTHGIEVYEYGYAGYDFANQIYLVHAYKNDFQYIDQIVLYLKYENDLERDIYKPNTDRIKLLSSTIFKIRNNIKLLSYGTKIGILSPIKNLVKRGMAFNNSTEGYQTNELKGSKAEELKVDQKRIANFKKLIEVYGFDKNKTSLLLDSRTTSERFLEFCRSNNIRYIDFSTSFKNSKKPTTLIYDHHWNAHGRSIIAKVLAHDLKEQQK
ncbi:hypothetical protein D9O36_13695 [Zobellia amurskyensis]|uniref:SGNH/GDSL hydrolase family protein n=1 Tax=Zobellia amurskyensis TaxID=248905 RepID=A0A7X2ZV12_9FLAO|nr:hypothetical protein [Zobellia amurskyensis]MUH36902.1 hypothetical protein [Zobellia amurskyensis]